eukprot:6670365-Alexandrium_andersonii.AAC.1
MLDLEVGPWTDLLDARTQEAIREKARAGWCHGGRGVPPCATWSMALFSPCPGDPVPGPTGT